MEDTRWKRGEFVVVERVRKQTESEDGGNERVERDERGQTIERVRWKGGEKVRMKVDEERKGNEGES